MSDNPFAALSLIAGPAVLTNACAIMQNSATMRYSLAISQWRDFRAALSAEDDSLPGLYVDGKAALRLAERRLRLLLRGLNLLYAGVALFGAASLVGLGGAVLAASGSGPELPVTLVVALAGGGVVALVGAALLFVGESSCARSMLALQLQARDAKSADGEIGSYAVP